MNSFTDHVVLKVQKSRSVVMAKGLIALGTPKSTIGIGSQTD